MFKIYTTLQRVILYYWQKWNQLYNRNWESTWPGEEEDVDEIDKPLALDTSMVAKPEKKKPKAEVYTYEKTVSISFARLGRLIGLLFPGLVSNR